MEKFVVEKDGIFWPSEELKRNAWVNDAEIYEIAARDPIAFWSQLAKEGISWFKEFDRSYEEELPHFKWFVGGKLNASYNCLDRHLSQRAQKLAIIWESEDGVRKTFTYKQLYQLVNRFANSLKALGIQRGDRVSIYLPMIPEVHISILACARIGAIHSVVFSAFSPEALRKRILDAGAKLLITADGYLRRGKVINLKAQADEGIKDTSVEKVIVVRRMENEINWVEGRDHWFHELLKGSSYCEPEWMDAEDPLFILYTSGTTGVPKGACHTTGGYLTQAYWTAKWSFNLHEDDVMWCTADIGWITGHTYACYGPLLNGATIFICEGVPDYPQVDRWAQIIEEYGVTIFYTAPTFIRLLIKYGEEHARKHDLSSLRILGSVGEPIDKDTWLWFFNVVGGGRCPIIDTWWQTETGGALINALPGIGPFIPTVAGRGFPGLRYAVVDENGNEVKVGEHGSLVILPPLPPGMLRNIWGNSQRYIDEYWSRFPNMYYTGDGALRFDEFLVRLTGREDDVLKVSGYRIANAEIEDIINSHEDVIESAVVGLPDPVRGEVPVAFVVLKPNVVGSDALSQQLLELVNRKLSPIARPSKIIYVNDLPKTRSGKIMRRILKKIVRGEKEIGDISTLANPECVDMLKNLVI